MSFTLDRKLLLNILEVVGLLGVEVAVGCHVVVVVQAYVSCCAICCRLKNNVALVSILSFFAKRESAGGDAMPQLLEIEPPRLTTCGRET